MIWVLLLTYQLKHFLCDYPLQRPWMLGKFLPWPKFILPLLAHSAVHGVATFLIALAVKPKSAFLLALLDMAVHFAVDRVKASPSMLGRFKPLTASTYGMALNMSKGLGMTTGKPMDLTDETSLNNYKAMGLRDLKGNTYFWWALGADQLAHHVTHYFIIWSLLS